MYNTLQTTVCFGVYNNLHSSHLRFAARQFRDTTPCHRAYLLNHLATKGHRVNRYLLHLSGQSESQRTQSGFKLWIFFQIGNLFNFFFFLVVSEWKKKMQFGSESQQLLWVKHLKPGFLFCPSLTLSVSTWQKKETTFLYNSIKD